MSLPLIELSGSPFAQGRRHGRLLRPEIEHNLGVYFDRFYREGGVSRQEVLRRARRYAQSIEADNQHYFDGMRGVAAGAGFDLAEIVALNVRYEILYYQYTVRQTAAARDGCTAFALSPQKSSNGHLWLGQNWDWIPQVKGAILNTTHDDGLHTLAFTEAGIFGGKIGLNSAGLGLAINGISTTDDDWQRLTSPFHVRCYEILLQRDISAAGAVIDQEPRACSANYLIAATPDRAINIEAAPQTVNVLEWRQGCLVHTNHFVDPQKTGVEEPPDDLRRFSYLRYQRLQTFLRETPGISREALQSLLQDHENSPRSICRHEDPKSPVDEQYRTVTSVTMDLHERRMWATDGPPCANPYVSYRLRKTSKSNTR